MEAPNIKQNSREYLPGETIEVAKGEKTIVIVPFIVPPIEVKIPLRTVLIEVGDIAVVIDLAGRASCETPSIPLPLECSRGCIVFATCCVAERLTPTCL